MTDRLRSVVDGYLIAALWTSEDDPEIGPDMAISDIAYEARREAQEDCRSFLEQAGTLADRLADSSIGHDIWMTRNHHGVGFWDRGLGHVGTDLTKIAEQMGERTLYRGDDGKLYFA